MKKIIFCLLISILVQCKRHHLEPVPINSEIFLFDTIIGNSIHYSPDSNKLRTITVHHSYRQMGVSIEYSSDAFLRHKYLYRYKKVYYPYEYDSYIHLQDSFCYYMLNFIFRNNKLDSVSLHRVSNPYDYYGYRDHDFLGRKYFSITKAAAIDTLKNWGFIDDNLQYIVENLKKR